MTNEPTESLWETVETIGEFDDIVETTETLKVNGGQIYSRIICGNVALCFVPDIDLRRYESHLRDAYKQGYNAGFSDAKNGLDLDTLVDKK